MTTATVMEPAARLRLEWAQWAAEKGINVFVIQPNSKRPLDGHSWYLRQTDNPALVESWFEQTPDCNYGCHLGEQFVVIDLDRKPGADGVIAFEDLCRENDVENFLLELDTLTVETPSGGYHLYFKSPFPCANRNSFPDGIDVRGVVGYVVGPGSADSRGEWTVLDPEAPIAELPEWLHGYLEKPGYKDPNNDVPVTELDQPENIEHATAWLEDREPAIAGANGDDHTYETCQWLRDFGLSEGAIVQALIDSGWNAKCDPPWSESELEKKVENAWRYGQNRPGVKSPTYKVERLTRARPEGGWAAHLTKEQVEELFHPSVSDDLDLETEPGDDEIPVLVPDESAPPVVTPWASFGEFIAAEAVREYVVQELLLAHGITYMIGRRGAGKSTVALDIGLRIACDLDWHGKKIAPGWKVVYLCLEDEVGLRLNARAWAEENETSPDSDRFRINNVAVKLTDRDTLRARAQELKEWADGAPCVVILDTWQRATSGWSKNDQELMERAVGRAEAFARYLGGPLLSCVHPPKQGALTVVGSGVQEDTSAGIFHLEEKANGVRRLFVERLKGPGQGAEYFLKLEKRTLPGRDQFGVPFKGLVVVETEQAVAQAAAVTSGQSPKGREEDNAIVRALVDILLDAEDAAEREDADVERLSVREMALRLKHCEIALKDGTVFTRNERRMSERLKAIFLHEREDGTVEHLARTVETEVGMIRVKLTPGTTRDGRQKIGGKTPYFFQIERVEISNQAAE